MSEIPARIVSSWGNLIRAEHAVYGLRGRSDGFPEFSPPLTLLPYGNGRSYGDSCLNVGGALLDTRALDRFIHFDRERGLLACESGVQLADILGLVIPAGWFPCVLPGTQFVTVGGAIANDVHGKNHQHAGTFGRHVSRLELLRSSGERLQCSPQERGDWFGATVGGLGLTGLITWAELALRRIAGPWLDVESIRFETLDDFFALSSESDRDFEYTVAWIDCLAKGRSLGRGLLQRANHSSEPAAARDSAVIPGRLGVPFSPPIPLVNRATLRLFNMLYYARGRRRTRGRVHYQSFFFPLDGIRNWNRLYGRSGLYQYQCVVPGPGAREAVRELLQTIAASGRGSFLAVLKCFGDLRSPGILSFPREGATLALDFPNSGGLDSLFARLDAIVAGAGGRLYPAKDARMPAHLFRSGFPRWRELVPYIDPRFSSSFWRRVAGES